jgi:hypothetical protein
MPQLKEAKIRCQCELVPNLKQKCAMSVGAGAQPQEWHAQPGILATGSIIEIVPMALFFGFLPCRSITQMRKASEEEISGTVIT